MRGNSLFSAGRTSTSLGTSGTRIGSLHLEHYSVAISAARQRCAVEIANNIDDHTSVGFRSVRALRAEAIQHVLRPVPVRCGRQLEHCPDAVRAAKERGAVEIACGVEDQAGEGLRPVRAVSETMQHVLRPTPAGCRRQLKHCPRTISATVVRRAVEVAGGIDNEASLWLVPVRVVVVEAIQHLFRPTPVSCRRYLERRPGVVGAPIHSRAVEAARGTEDHAGPGALPSPPLKLCSTCSVQPPPAVGVNSCTVPKP